MTIIDVRLPCPECHDPAKAKRIILRVGEAAEPRRFDWVACSNADCWRWDPGPWSSALT
jgi:hypothetical protein